MTLIFAIDPCCTDPHLVVAELHPHHQMIIAALPTPTREDPVPRNSSRYLTSAWQETITGALAETYQDWADDPVAAEQFAATAIQAIAQTLPDGECATLLPWPRERHVWNRWRLIDVPHGPFKVDQEQQRECVRCGRIQRDGLCP